MPRSARLIIADRILDILLPYGFISAVLAQKKDKAMITGQGRWGLYVKRPSAMIEYYRQASLEEKLNTTDLTITKKPTKPKQL